MTKVACVSLSFVTLAAVGAVIHLLSPVPEEIVYLPAALALIIFQILALEQKYARLFDWLEYGYYFLGAVGVALFFVAELHEVTTLQVGTIDSQLQTLEERRARAAAQQDQAFLATCRRPVAGETQTNVFDPVREACSDAVRLAANPKFLMPEIEDLKSRRQRLITERPILPTDHGRRAKYFIAPMVTLVAIALKLGKTTSTICWRAT